MSTYNATNWPPIQYPLPTPHKEIWNAQAYPVPPSQALPVFTAQKENWTAQAPLVPPSQALPAFTTAKVTWQAAAVAPNTTTYLSPITTQIAINATFNIIERRLSPVSTTLDANGNTVIIAPPR